MGQMTLYSVTTGLALGMLALGVLLKLARLTGSRWWLIWAFDFALIVCREVAILAEWKIGPILPPGWVEMESLLAVLVTRGLFLWGAIAALAAWDQRLKMINVRDRGARV